MSFSDVDFNMLKIRYLGEWFEYRTHRNNTLKPLKVNHFQGLFSWGLNRETNLMTHRDAF